VTKSSRPETGSDPGTTATEIGRTLPATPAGAPAVPSPLANRRLAHFRLERPLGKGGMGEVWLATDLALERPVAVKLLSRDLSADPSLRERFYREARAQARILHPNVGHIYFIGEDDGQLFFAMELIDGESLAERLARAGKLPADEALALCRQAALGLREAHRHGFTHRDVKPSNLMIDRHGAVKLVDFGLVKQQRAENVALTLESGMGVMGTPLYMAPEQARSGQVDFRTDIYALGATLHHLIAGAPPFLGDTAMQVVSKHLSDPRPHIAAARKQNPALDPLLDRMMAKEPDARYASYDDLLVAVDQAAPALRRPAGFFVRAAAMVLDLLLVLLLVQLPLSSILPEYLTSATLYPILLVYCVGSTVRFGRTIGKWLLEIEVVPEGRHGRMGWKTAAVRFLAQQGWLWAGAALLEWHSLVRPLAAKQDRPERLAVIAVALLICVVPIVVGGIAAVFRSDRRTFWDRFAGTRVRYRARG
jgi:serine/threonine protein kinase